MYSWHQEEIIGRVVVAVVAGEVEAEAEVVEVVAVVLETIEMIVVDMMKAAVVDITVVAVVAVVAMMMVDLEATEVEVAPIMEAMVVIAEEETEVDSKEIVMVAFEVEEPAAAVAVDLVVVEEGMVVVKGTGNVRTQIAETRISHGVNSAIDVTKTNLPMLAVQVAVIQTDGVLQEEVAVAVAEDLEEEEVLVVVEVEVVVVVEVVDLLDTTTVIIVIDHIDSILKTILSRSYIYKVDGFCNCFPYSCTILDKNSV